MKIDKIIYDIREGVRAITDDTEISDRYILHLVNINRAEAIRHLLNNFQRITPATINQSFCIDMIEVNASDCNVDGCETILRSSKPIPVPLELYSKAAITSIRPTVKLSKRLIFTTKERALFTINAPFKNTITAYIDNDQYIYVTGKNLTHKLIQCLSITGVFEDPLELENYKNCCNCESDTTTCFDYSTSEYPVPAHLVKSIRDSVVKQLIDSLRVPNDLINNSDEQ